MGETENHDNDVAREIIQGFVHALHERTLTETASVLMALINGLVRQQSYKRDDLSGVREAAVSFCRFSLVNP